ncbi:hypothetical protein [Clostridium sp. JS66]|uniref:hypothetical protein n=1 Tax=Clostridium sp. JS66 TaxID=3064705 RepID=UPI00298E840F|nr:hypothetical protein [Clostridium sp. JS66]WPC42656.1 hypothetical protein Q6H37_04070 [Clostridium sp. JS66]
MKKKKLSKLYMVSNNSEVSERRYKQALEANKRTLLAIYNSLAAYVPFGFYPYECPIFEQVNPSNNKLENSKIDKLLKKQDE